MRVLALLPFILLSGAALTPEAMPQEPLARAQACAEIADNAARLACFDAAIAAYKSAAPSSTVMTQPKAPPAASFGQPQPDKTPDAISSPISKIETGADGKLRFTLQDGQVWRQTDTTRLRNLGDGPWTAEVRKAALGSFMLKVDGRTAVRVKRVE